MRRVWYFIREAIISIRTHRTGTLIGILTTAFTLTSFGVFLLLYHNVNNLLDRIQHNIQIIVYPKEGLEPAKLDEMKQFLKSNQIVESLIFISKQQALEDFKKQFPNEMHLLEGLPDNPFPSSFILTLTSSTPSTDVTAHLMNRLHDHQDIERVKYNRDWIERLTLIVTYLQWGALIIGGILATASMAIIANTVQLAFYTRQEEMEILRLIGATRLFISIPYLIEGALLGALGGGLAIGFLRSGFAVFKHRIESLSVIGGFSSAFEFFPVPFSLTLLVGGIVLGCMGTLATMLGWMKLR
ncbi:MAG: cell division protein FtsX [Nitrospirales bacterium]